MGRDGSGGVLITAVSAIVPEKSCGNKKCDGEEEEQEAPLSPRDRAMRRVN